MNSATKLSQLHAVKPALNLHNTQARVIAISSGKGGVGKSTVSLNLAIELSRQKYRVCLFDADTNLANITIMTGLTPQHSLQDYVKHDKPLKDIMLHGPGGIKIIPAASGLMDFVSYDSLQQDKLIRLITMLESKFDFILIDTAAGINETVLSFIRAATETIITITPEPTSLTDAFSLLKVLSQQGFNQSVQVLVNKAPSYESAKEVLKRFSVALKKYLGLSISVPGYVLEDKNVGRSVMSQIPCVLIYPESPASLCLRTFAHKIIDRNKQPVSLFSNFLTQQIKPTEKNCAVEQSEKTKPWMNSVLDAIQSAPIEEAEQLMAQLSKHWIERLDAEEETEKYLNSAGFKAAVRFASKLKI